MNSNLNDNFKSTRAGFTLVELLFVIAIIAILASMTAGILGKAKRDSEISATRSRITQIEAIMQTVTEDFEVRRLPFRNSDLARFVRSSLPANRQREVRMRVRNLRRRVVAAMLQAEFPVALLDGNGDFVVNSEIGQLAPASIAGEYSFRQWLGDTYDPALLTELEASRSAEMSFWQSIATTPGPGAIGPRLDQPGEYLYIILERIDVDGSSALELLGPNAVGDTDDDGVPEIVDAFGDSMQLRIVQVAVNNIPINIPIASVDDLPPDDIWTDVPPSEINWNRLTDRGGGVKVPQGYQFLNPVIPRSINQIRFQVVSPQLEEIE